MPCLVITGHPCAGKTQFCLKLKARALVHSLIEAVEIINEESVCVNMSKSEAYGSSFAEKSTRSSLKAQVDRRIQTGNDATLIIVDSLNYIKGYRYELHCISKAANQRHGVVWVLNSLDVARQWNQERSDRYTDDQMKELVLRYEPPDARNRWDKPLWKVDLTPSSGNDNNGDAAQDALKESVYNMHDLSEAITTDAAPAVVVAPKKKSAFKRIRPTNTSRTAVEEPTTTTMKEPETPQEPTEAPPEAATKKKTVEEQIDDILDSFLLNVAPLKQGMSTKSYVSTHSNVLHDIDSLTLQVCNALVKAQAYGGTQITLTDFGDSLTMSCPRQVPLTELKRLRKQYVRWASKVPPEDTSRRGLAESFCQYIETQID